MTIRLRKCGIDTIQLSNGEGSRIAYLLVGDEAADALMQMQEEARRYRASGHGPKRDFDLTPVFAAICEIKGQMELLANLEGKTMTDTFEKLTPANHVRKDNKGTGQQDDYACYDLHTKMKAKLKKKREQGSGGWNHKETTAMQLSSQLLHHVVKGDPVDVANYCAFLAARGERIELVPGGNYEAMIDLWMCASDLARTKAQTPERQQLLDRLRKIVTGT